MTTAPPAPDLRDRALFEMTLDGIVILDDAGTYIDVNDALCAMLRATREQLIGRLFLDLIPSSHREAAIAAFGDFRSSGVFTAEFPLQALDGSIVKLEWRSRANFVPGFHLCVGRDLQPREETEAALRASEERYRAFMATTTEAIWRFELEEPIAVDLDAETQLAEFYRVAYLAECNEAVAQMYGFARSEEIVGARLGEMLPDSPENLEYLRAFIASGYRLSGAESKEYDRDGNEKHFRNSLVGIVDDGKLLRVWGTQRDVTQERLLEQRRDALLVRLEFLADVTSVLGSSLDYDQTLQTIARIAVPRFSDWCFVDVLDANGEVERVAVHHLDEELVTLAIELEWRYPPPTDVDVGTRYTIRSGVTQLFDIDEELVAQVAKSDEHRAMLQKLAFKQGLVVPLVARGRTLGALSFAFAESSRRFAPEDVQLAEDIGRRAGLAIDNARLYGELDRANRAKDDFLAMLSHELRTPMTATLGWATMMQRGEMAPDLLATAADAIVQSTRAQARLIDDLLDVSRIISGKMQLVLQPVSIADVVRAAMETVQPAADAKQLRVATAIHDRGLRLNGDGERLQQVFWNLLSNAVKFTPRGGRVEVELTRDGDAARVVVRDTGEGIEPELLPHIFERFRQGDSGASRKFGGLGLGLSIARNLVELHGGTLTARSGGTGQGTEMTVLLPLTANPAMIAAAAQPQGVTLLAGLSLLLIEDDPATRQMLTFALRRYGADVTAAPDAQEAFAILGTRSFDAIVSDIGLPGEDGVMLMQRIRNAKNPTAAIALTAYASTAERDRALAAGFQMWLAKPVEPSVLADAVKRLTSST